MAAATDFNPYDAPPKGDNVFARITDNVSRIAENPRPPRAWYIAFGIAQLLLLTFLGSLGWLAWTGIGIWGNQMPVAWAFDIVNFVFWVGIGHAGTLISAILFLLRQNWRTAINRFAEAMTIFAVIQAGVYPLMHIGRHQYAYWMFPLPNSMGLWPQFRSPLMWDVFAISTYMTVSILFWLVGLIPDFATMRDRATNKWAKIAFGMAALGWRGSALHWRRYMQLYLLLAGLSTPLVLSVHTIVSFDFSFGNVPGWHSTIFPPYFVAGAVFAGFAMTLILAIPLRAICNLRDLITMRHLENMAKVMLATGLIVFYGYLMEVFFGWYSANPYERHMTFDNRMFGHYAWSYWALIICNGIIPQFLWIKKLRTNIPFLFFCAVVVSIGMWLERVVIIVTSLSFQHLPDMWSTYTASATDWMIYIGTMGFFTLLFLLFARLIPSISIAEMRELILHHGHSAGAADEHVQAQVAR